MQLAGAIAACDKVTTLEELARITGVLKYEGRAIVQCHGVFDLLHPGHIRHLEAAKRLGDVLLVTVTPDEHVNKGPGRPVFNHRLRAETIAAIQCVDYVAVNEWPTAVEAIRRLRPDVYVKGSDYLARDEDLTGKITDEEEAVLSVGGRIHFTNEITFSSTKLLNDHFAVYPEASHSFLRSFRNKYSANQIIQMLKDLNKLKVLVLGEAIIDEYHYCRAMGKSPKENIITTKYLSEEVFAGGALAAANHAAGFCGQVHVVTCVGAKDSKEDFIRSHLKENVTMKLFKRGDAPTVVKRRFVDTDFLTKMFEICFLEYHHLPEDLEMDVSAYLNERAPQYDLVLVNDFGHGFIGQRTIDVLAERSRFLVVNTQTNSANVGFNLVTKYPRADYVCIDEPEMRLAMGDRFSDLESLALELSSFLGYERVAVTCGHRGSLVYGKDEGFTMVPIFSNRVVDRIGAGDAYLSVTGPCTLAGYPMEVVGFVGNAVGALAVRIIGNKTPVEPVPLFKFITALLG